MKKTVDSYNRNFFIISVFLFILHQVPFIGALTPNYLYAGIVVLLCLSTYLLSGYRFLNYFSISLIICSVPFIRELSISSSFITSLYVLLQYTISFTVGLCIIRQNDYYSAKRILPFLIIAYTITAITTYFGNLKLPEASRILATASDMYDDALRKEISFLNIGGFSFIYTLVLWIPLLFGMIKIWKKGIILYLFMIICFYATIYVSEYTTALLVSVFSILLLFGSENMDAKKSRFFIIVYGVILVVVITIIPMVVVLFSDRIESHLVNARLGELSDFVNNPISASTDSHSDLVSRKNLYSKSLDAFLSSPVWGSLSTKQLGGHSLLFDTIGLLGVLGGILYYLSWKKIYTSFLKPFKDKPFYGYFLFSFLSSLVLTILNPASYIYFFSLIVPVTLVCLNNSVIKRQ